MKGAAMTGDRTATIIIIAVIIIFFALQTWAV